MSASVNTPRALAIVPARLASVRLPRKMLLAETGLPLCVHTVRNLRRCAALERIVLAVDDEEVAAAARAHGVDAVLTRVEHPSGTDRVFEAASKVGGAFDVVVNVQGDEPELDPADLARLVAVFASPEVEAATLAAAFVDPAEALAPQVVKVVRDERGDALYFSRAPIPHRSTDPTRAYARADARPWSEVARRHVGVYAFRPAALERFVRSSPGTLECLENLEQLRWLEQGRRMRVVDAGQVPLGIDTRADYDAFVGRFRSAGAR
jgi:3-deoxy-manno-octulosonate cytidylyltransferase (CMP-KDO synthetase)